MALKKRGADRLIVAGRAAFGLAAIVGTVRHFGGIVALGGAAPAARGAGAPRGRVWGTFCNSPPYAPPRAPGGGRSGG
ncbi:hypothetical protein [Hydrogenibacillus schlegelii]|uniref:hypothetical protein n=1 Tax=Hydrogenibacillus schlegelii TaxID=1484 RepID=UPI0034A08456